MKRLLTWIALFATATGARADLVMHEQADFGNPTNLIAITIKIHGDKIRQDVNGLSTGDMSVIKNAKTGDSIVLLHPQKLFTKPAPKTTDIQSPDAALSKPRDMGNSAQVNGYQTEIYAWAANRKLWNNTNGMIETLWVAKDFPGFDRMKPDLAELDRANVAFPGKGMQPGVSTLPGMVVKSRLVVKMGEAVQTITITLLTAKEEPVDPSAFDVPANYKEWIPPQSPGPPAPATAPDK
jgi:Domain of unknown function (DUF4412)